MNKAVIIRFHYDKNNPDFKWRFNYFKKEVLPRILNQSIQDFDICIWCESHHDELFKSLSSKIKVFKSLYEKKVDAKTLYDYSPFEKVKGLEKYNLQLGLDSDDMIESNLLEKLEEICKKENRKTLISIQPIKKHLRTGKKYRMKSYERRNRCSPCFAIYQPEIKEDYEWPYYRSHYRLNFDFNNVIYLDEGYCTMSIHNFNDSTKIGNEDILI